MNDAPDNVVPFQSRIRLGTNSGGMTVTARYNGIEVHGYTFWDCLGTLRQILNVAVFHPEVQTITLRLVPRPERLHISPPPPEPPKIVARNPNPQASMWSWLRSWLRRPKAVDNP